MLSARGAAPVAAVLLVLLLALGCVKTVRGQIHPALLDRRAPIGKVAIVPLRITGSLARKLQAEGPGRPHTGGELIARHLAEALATRGVSVIPAGDVARALAREEAAPGREMTALAARVAAAEFGADAVLLGEVSRFVERTGEAAGTLQPASVSFVVTLYDAPRGIALWTGAFDETQRALSENILNARRYPGGGSRWLSAEELARWGAAEVAAALPLAP